MTKSFSTKRSLITSVIALMLCFSMLLGTTFAWFTDSVTSASNVIQSGNLNVDVEYTLDGTTWKNLDKAEDLFQKGLWEPGHTEVVALKVTNAGSLALKYTAMINRVENLIGLTKDGAEIDLANILTVDSMRTGDAADVTDAFANENKAYTESKLFVDAYTLATTDYELAAGGVDYVIIKVDMAETVGNEANHNGTDIPQIKFGVNVYATQVEAENDSFGDNYDASADYKDMPTQPAKVVKAKTAEELKTALSEGNSVTLSNNIDLTEPLVIAPTSADTVTINLNGKTISGTEDTLIKITSGNVEISGGKIKNVVPNATTTNTSISLTGNAVAKIENVEIETTGTGISLSGNARISKLNATIDSHLDAMGNLSFDGVVLNDNARIDEISGGKYESYYSKELIQSWFEDPKHIYSALVSAPIHIMSSAASIGEIKGGTFLGEMDKAFNGTPIRVNAGRIDKITGGYFGFTRFGLTQPEKMLFVNSGNGASIGEITGGTFETGTYKYGCEFENIVANSGCKVVDTGDTVEIKTQFSTKIASNTLKVVEVVPN